MFKLVALAVCAGLMVSEVRAQLGGSGLMEMMLMSQILNNNNNNQGSGTGATGSATSATSGTPGLSGALGAIAGGRSTSGGSSNPFSSMFGGNSGSTSGTSSMLRNMFLLNGNTEAMMDVWSCGYFGLHPLACASRYMV